MVYLTAEQVWLTHVMILLREAMEPPNAVQSLEELRALIDEDTRRMRPELLDSAVFAPQQPYFSNFWQRAAAFVRSLAKNHAFFDGNKRTALISLEVFLLVNGYDLDATQKQKVRFILGVARGSRLWSIESWLRHHVRAAKEANTEERATGILQGLGSLVERIGAWRPFGGE